MCHSAPSASMPASLLNDPGQLRAHIAKNVRGIRNIQLGSSDFLPLINGKAKIPGAALNAFGAALQQIAERVDGHSDFCTFSSWLGPLISGKLNEGGLQGTINDHIKAAVRNKNLHQIFSNQNWHCWNEHRPREEQLHHYSPKSVG